MPSHLDIPPPKLAVDARRDEDCEKPYWAAAEYAAGKDKTTVQKTREREKKQTKSANKGN